MLAGDWTQSDAYHRPRDSRADGTGRRGSWPVPLASVPLASVPLASVPLAPRPESPRRISSGRILSGVLPAWTHRIIIARMARTTWIAGVITLFVSTASAAVGSDDHAAVESFLQAYCLACHDPDTSTRLNLTELERELETSAVSQRTTRLFPGITWERVSGRPAPQRAWRPVLTRPPGEHLRDVVQQFAERAWHRRVEEQELQTLVSLAEPSLAAGRDFVDCVRIPLRAILVSPELLFQTGSGGPLTDSQLARRLAAFLWRSAPDDRLMHLARQGRLSEQAVLLAEVDRLLADSRRDRFVNDFLDQWLNLAQIDATTPDAYLYPEYDDVLRRAMLAETRQFFAHLLDENLSVACLVDSDFTFLNRRMAEHYGIAGVTGEALRKVRLPPDSVRGGLLGQASLAKVTANGTVTSPVRRGHFVLSKILGQPASPPPPDVGSIEPDTRGATTIRETLRKHQAVDTCAACHRHIDPPGFALECFDPVGSFRSHYRISRGVRRTAAVGLRFLRPDYDQGPPVDASGVLEDGRTFDGIRQYREQLLTQTDQVARNMVSLLVTYATGAPIQFADRQEIDDILARNKAAGYPLRQLLSDVVTSRIFRNR